MANKHSTFQVFRYQILPIDRYQLNLFERKYNIDELLDRKNDIFADVLSKQNDFSNDKHQTAAKMLRNEGDFFIFQINHNKKINRETKDFKKEEIDIWPSILVLIWNHPEKQYILVEKRTTAFSECKMAVKLILAKVNKLLGLENLRAVYEPLFEKQMFWDKVDEYRGKIKVIKFEIITPNMANISGSLPDDLKNFAKSTNSTRNELKIEAEPDSSLVLERGDKNLEGLVDYSSEGGGNISIKAIGMKAKYQTSNTIKEIYIDEIELNSSLENIKSIVKELTND